MKRLLLVRHGETDWNRAGRFQGQTDIGLNERGREEARALAERLRDRGVSAVAASDLARARETAEVLATALVLPTVRVDPELRERAYGVFEGLTREECAERFPREWPRHLAGEIIESIGAEPRPRVAERMTRAVSRLFDPTLGEVVVVVSHGGAMRAFIDRALGIDVPPIRNLELFELDWDEARARWTRR